MARWNSWLLTFRAGGSTRDKAPTFGQLGVEVADGRIMAGELGSGYARLSARAEIALAEQVARRDHRGAHRPVFVCALRPRQVAVQPKIKAHTFRQAPT